MVSYRQILKTAWQITWRHKKLWFLGVFAAWLGTAGEPNFIFKSLNSSNPGILQQLWQGIIGSGILTLTGLKNLSQRAATEPLSVLRAVLILLFLLGITAIIIRLIVIAQGALIYGTAYINANKKFNLKPARQVGIKKFWPIFGLNAFEFVVLSALFYSLTLLAYANIFLFILVFNLVMLGSIILSFIIKYSACEVVLRNIGLVKAIKNGFTLFYKNWLSSVKLALFLFAINMIGSLILIVLVLLVLTPFLFIIYTSLLLKLTFIAAFNISLLFILIIGIILLASSILATLYWSAWTIMYVQLVMGSGLNSRRPQ